MQANAVCWFEIYVDDLERATKFYESVFDLKLERLDAPMAELQMMSFPMSTQNFGASGALCQMDGVKAGGGATLVYFGCADCEVEASRIEAAGGRLEIPKTSIGAHGFFAVGVDTEGNRFGLHTPAPEERRQ